MCGLTSGGRASPSLPTPLCRSGSARTFSRTQVRRLAVTLRCATSGCTGPWVHAGGVWTCHFPPPSPSSPKAPLPPLDPHVVQMLRTTRRRRWKRCSSRSAAPASARASQMRQLRRLCPHPAAAAASSRLQQLCSRTVAQAAMGRQTETRPPAATQRGSRAPRQQPSGRKRRAAGVSPQH